MMNLRMKRHARVWSTTENMARETEGRALKKIMIATKIIGMFCGVGSESTYRSIKRNSSIQKTIVSTRTTLNCTRRYSVMVSEEKGRAERR